MKKENLLKKLWVISFLFGIIMSMNAQVFVDSTGTGIYTNIGASASFTGANDISGMRIEDGGTVSISEGGGDGTFGTITVKKGGVLNVVSFKWGDDIGSLLVDSGTVSASSLYIGDSLEVGSGSIFNVIGECSGNTKNQGKALKFEFDSSSTIGIATLNITGETQVINHVQGLSFNLIISGQNNKKNFLISGSESVILERVQFYQNTSLTNATLTCSNDMILNGDVQCRNIKDNAFNAILGFKFLAPGNNIIINNSAKFSYNTGGCGLQVKNGDTKVKIQANRTDTVEIPFIEANGYREIMFGAGLSSATGDTSYVNIEYANSPFALNMGSSYLNKYYRVSFEKVQSADFFFTAQYAGSDFTGDSSSLKSALFDTAASNWDFGTALGADSLYYNITKEGMLTARLPFNPLMIILIDTIVESMIENAIVQFELQDAFFVDSAIATGSIILTNAPLGVSVDSVHYSTDYEAIAYLSSDSINFDANVHLIFTIDASEISITQVVVDSVVLKAQNNNATLSGLTTSADSALSPVFASGTYNYTVALASGTTATPSVTPILADASAYVSVVDASDVTSAIASDRTTIITVRSEDLSTVNVYSVEFNVTPSLPVTILSLLQNELNAWPIPAVDVLTISTNKGDVIELYTILGNVVFFEIASSNIVKIDVSTIKSGNYILRVGNNVKLIPIQ